jgi:hypothetical protein
MWPNYAIGQVSVTLVGMLKSLPPRRLQSLQRFGQSSLVARCGYAERRVNRRAIAIMNAATRESVSEELSIYAAVPSTRSRKVER